MDPITLITAGMAVLPKLPALWGTVAGWFGKETPKSIEKAGELAGTVMDMLKKGEIPPEMQATMAAELNRHEEAILAIQAAAEKSAQDNLTARHVADASGTSWLSKNVRPLILIAVTINVIVATYAEVSVAKYTALVDLVLIVFGYYFIGKTVERGTVATIAGAFRGKP